MKIVYSLLPSLVCVLFVSSVAVFGREESELHIIPQPQKVEMLKGEFKITGAAVRIDPRLDTLSVKAVARFAADLSLVSGRTSTVSSPVGIDKSAERGEAKGVLFLKDSSLDREEYRISVGTKALTVRASGPEGILYSLATLRQMLPCSIFAKEPSAKDKWTIPCCEISDRPRYAYRGMHLDCARHFWSVDQIKRYLDAMAMFKLNRFHWHLTDDQGWRIEIKAYPLLSRIASYREGTMIGHDFNSSDHIRYGGCYSQDDVREVVAYARERGIEVVPEIDLPGHMLAAMSAYPHLGCSGGPYAAWTRWGVSDEVLCAGKESTYEFLEAVLSEVVELFPSEYIHIGGDECPKTEWENCPDCQAKIAALGLKDDDKFTAEQYLQNYVTERISSFLASKGKKVMGWDEILEGLSGADVTIMSWRGTDGAVAAAKAGMDAVMTPNSYLYFDYCQSEDRDSEPLGIGGFVSLERVYSFEPAEGLSPEEQKHILGVQANLWTEYISTEEHLQYMLLPRLLALSEVQWCSPEVKDYERFSSSLEEKGFPMLSAAGYNYRKK